MADPPSSPEPSAHAARRRRLLRRFALAALVALVVVASSWYVLFFWAESTGRLERWVSRRPDRFQLRWREIGSPWPFVVEAEGLVVAARTRRVRWQITGDRARVTIDPLALLDRRLVLRDATLSGAAVQVARQLPAEGEGASQPVARQPPPIVPFPEGPAPTAAPRPKPWSWIVDDLAFDDLREVWIDDLRVIGLGSGELSLALRRREWAEVGPSRLRLENVRATFDGKTLGDRLGGEVTLQIVPWRYAGAKAAEVSRSIQGSIALSGEAPIAPALAYLFGERPWLALAADLAAFESSITVDRGRLRSGSRIEATLAPTLTAFGFVAAGPARLRAEVEGDRDSERLESTLTLGRWTLARPDEAPLFTGEGLRVDAWSEAPRTDKPPAGHRLVVDLGNGRADDLRFVNAFVPRSAEVAVERGSVALTGQLRFDSNERSGSGELAVAGERLTLRVRGQRFVADLGADVRLSEPDLAAAGFSLAGTKLSITKLHAATADGARIADWWSEVELRSGRVTLRRPFTSSGELVARSADTRPIIAFYELRRDLPSWAERALLLDDVRVSARYEVVPGRLDLRDVRLLFPNGEARAEVELARDHRHARLLLSWRRLDLGVELIGAERELHLLGARAWFEGRARKPR